MNEQTTLTPEQAREVLDVMARWVGYPSAYLRQSYTALATIEAEGVRPPFNERFEAARAGALNEETLPDLLQDPSVTVRRSLAERSDLPPEFQVVLARDPRIMETIAERSDLTPEAARLILESNRCHSTLAENRACPPEILEGLYERNPVNVANALASNPNTPPDLLHRIALEQSDKWPLWHIADHPNATLSTLGHLADSSDPDVARTARKTLSERLEQAQVVEWER